MSTNSNIAIEEVSSEVRELLQDAGYAYTEKKSEDGLGRSQAHYAIHFEGRGNQTRAMRILVSLEYYRTKGHIPVVKVTADACKPLPSPSGYHGNYAKVFCQRKDRSINSEGIKSCILEVADLCVKSMERVMESVDRMGRERDQRNAIESELLEMGLVRKDSHGLACPENEHEVGSSKATICYNHEGAKLSLDKLTPQQAKMVLDTLRETL